MVSISFSLPNGFPNWCLLLGLGFETLLPIWIQFGNNIYLTTKLVFFVSVGLGFEMSLPI